jgi:hypothetical protein
MKNQILIFLGLATAAATYIYLDWTVWQIIGAAVVVMFASIVDEKGPKWRQTIWGMLAFLSMVLAHFVVTDTVIYWGELLLSAIFFLLAVSAIFALMNSKPGDGSVGTAYFLGLIICIPLGFWFLYQGLENLGYQ